MSRQWKPGDVAAVKITDHLGRVEYDGAAVYGKQRGWAWPGGAFANTISVCADSAAGDVRPLVVIDPEDRRQMKGLADSFARHADLTTDGMTDLFREMANPSPPKPEEPTGLGAVVEDGEGNRWVRVNDVHWHGESSPMNRQTWGEITALRVLSEGVTS